MVLLCIWLAQQDLISYVLWVNLVSLFQFLGDTYWHPLEMVLRYLKGTMSCDIYFTGYPRVLEGYSDANWISDVYELYVTRETYTSYFYELCDNQTVITIVKSSKNNIKSTRHVKRQIKSVRKLRNSRVISLDYVHTSKNLGDQFIKGLSYHVIEGVTL